MDYDKIYIRDLLLRCIIGFNDDERREKQDVIVNVVLYADLTEPCRTDNVVDSVDYKTVKKNIIAMVEASSFLLIERLAEEIAGICLAHPFVRMAQVTVDKPGALRFSKSVAVEIMRRKEP